MVLAQQYGSLARWCHFRLNFSAVSTYFVDRLELVGRAWCFDHSLEILMYVVESLA
jgi:hypothetical protein